MTAGEAERRWVSEAEGHVLVPHCLLTLPQALLPVTAVCFEARTLRLEWGPSSLLVSH